MLFIISPAKSFNFDSKIAAPFTSVPTFLSEIFELLNQIRKLSAKDLVKLMKISDNLANLNVKRYQDFDVDFNVSNSKAAIAVFDGDVYRAMQPLGLNKSDLEFAQNNLRILSGFYGILKPLDLIQAYRLEMGVKFNNNKGSNLYEFWQEKITNFLNDELQNRQEKTIINIASQEYFSAINQKKIDGRIINIIFKEKKDNHYKIIGIYAKKARGAMANFIIKNKIQNSEDIKDFDLLRYKFNKDFSDKNNWCFCR